MNKNNHNFPDFLLFLVDKKKSVKRKKHFQGQINGVKKDVIFWGAAISGAPYNLLKPLSAFTKKIKT